MEIGHAPEAECAVCGGWPAALRPTMRGIIECIPLTKPLCKGCMVAFWRNCVGPVIEPPEPEPKG